MRSAVSASLPRPSRRASRARPRTSLKVTEVRAEWRGEKRRARPVPGDVTGKRNSGRIHREFYLEFTVVNSIWNSYEFTTVNSNRTSRELLNYKLNSTLL